MRESTMKGIKMYRDIKFRGLSQGTLEWVYGYFLINPSGECIYDPEIGDMPIISETTGQSTGLKDKSGKEIYEGDILLNDKNTNTMPGEKFIVKWLPGHFVAGGILGAGNHIGEDCKIISNIHQNPELLKD